MVLLGVQEALVPDLVGRQAGKGEAANAELPLGGDAAQGCLRAGPPGEAAGGLTHLLPSVPA